MPLHRFLTHLFIAAFLQSLTYGLTFLLPDLFAEIGGTLRDVGRFLTIVGALSVGTALCLGRLVRHSGHFGGLVLCCLCCSASLFLLGRADGIGPWTLLAAILMGFGWAGFYILGPIALVLVLEPARRPAGFTWLAAAVTAGIGAGPCLAYLVEVQGLAIQSAYFFASACSAVSALVFGVLGAGADRLRVAAPHAEQPLSWHAARRVLASPALRPIAMVLLGTAVFAAIMNFQTLYTEGTELSYATFFAVYTVTVILGRLAVARIVDAAPPFLLIAAFLFCMAVAVGLLAVPSPGPARYTACAVLFGLGYGLAYPIVKAMAAQDAAPGLREATLQLFGLAYFTGIFGFPYLGALAVETLGLTAMLSMAAGLAALECALAVDRHARERRARRQRTRHHRTT